MLPIRTLPYKDLNYTICSPPSHPLYNPQCSSPSTVQSTIQSTTYYVVLSTVFFTKLSCSLYRTHCVFRCKVTISALIQNHYVVTNAIELENIKVILTKKSYAVTEKENFDKGILAQWLLRYNDYLCG